MDGGSPITIQHEQKCILHVVCDSADAVLDCCGFTSMSMFWSPALVEGCGL